VIDRPASRTPLRAPIVVALVVFAAYWSLATHGKYSDTGDEPHYLLICESLRRDGDIDVGNNYERGDGAIFGAAGLERGLHARPNRFGRILPVHDVGVAVAILPVYVAAVGVATLPPDALLQRFRMNRGLFAYSIVSMAIMVLVSIAAAATTIALSHGGARFSAAVVLVAFLLPPVLDNAFVLFPEPFALVIVAWAVSRWNRVEDRWTGADVLLIAALGILPWFHRKYIPMALALAGLLVWRRRAALLQRGKGTLAGVALSFVVPLAILLLWTLYEWGNLAGPIALDGLPFSWSAFTHGFAGQFIDRENGLFWWAPVYLILPAAWWLDRSRVGVWLIPVLALMIPCAAHDQWWGGFSPAGRFLMPLVPIFCLAAAAAVESRVIRAAAALLLLPSLAIAAYGWQHPRALWPRSDGVNRVLDALIGSLHMKLPSFRGELAGAWVPAAILIAAIVLGNVALAIRARPRPGLILPT
jgi:hypothetical protein